MTKILPVQGTAGFPANPDPRLPKNWWRLGSPLMRYLAARGVEPLHPEDPYCWSTDLNGWRFWRRWFGTSDSVRDWCVGGKGLRWWLTAKGIDARALAIWCHSHGLQVVLFAAAEWHEPLFCQTLVSFGSPLREDVPWRDALPKIGRWLIVTDQHDLVQTLGRIGDGALGSFEELPANVEVLVIDQIDHSKLLQDPFFFDALEGHRIIAFTKGEDISYV